MILFHFKMFYASMYHTLTQNTDLLALPYLCSAQYARKSMLPCCLLERQQAMFDCHNLAVIPITLLCPLLIMYMLEHTPYASRQALAFVLSVIPFHQFLGVCSHTSAMLD